MSILLMHNMFLYSICVMAFIMVYAVLTGVPILDWGNLSFCEFLLAGLIGVCLSVVQGEDK